MSEELRRKLDERKRRIKLAEDKNEIVELLKQIPDVEFIRFAEEIDLQTFGEKFGDIYRLDRPPLSVISDKASDAELSNWFQDCLNSAGIGERCYLLFNSAPYAEIAIPANGKWLTLLWNGRPRTTILISGDKRKVLIFFVAEYTYDALFKEIA